MLRQTFAALSVCAILGLAPPVHAGAKFNTPVSVDPVFRRGLGAVGTARASADPIQYIYCYAVHGVSASAFCVARDAASTTVSCFTTDPAKVAIVGAMTSYSYVYFDYDASGTCTTLLVENASYYPPMVP